MRVLKRAALLSGVAFAGLGSYASASTPAGETFGGADLCYPASATFVQSTSSGNQYRLPATGVITSWSYQAGSAPFPQMQLKLARQQPDSSFQVVDESDIETPAANTLNTFETQISEASLGDFLGFWAGGATGGADCFRTNLAYGFSAAPGNVAPGSDPRNWVGAQYAQLDVAAVLEPDADNDDFGDESQDTCLPPAVRTDCDPPETTITKAPKLAIAKSPNRKLARRPARFKFGSDERGSIFECRLDRNRFKPCESPFRKLLKTDRLHAFKVRATDKGGNVDPSPAKARFKVTR